MGKLYTLTCPRCGGQIQHKVGYSVQELAELTRSGNPPMPDDDAPFACPHCGHLINPQEDTLDGFVAFID